AFLFCTLSMARAIPESGERPHYEQDAGDGLVKQVDPNDGEQDEYKIIDMRERLAAELHGCGEDETGRRCCHALESCCRQGTVAVSAVRYGHRIHEGRAGKANAAYRADRSGGAAQPVPH